MKSSNLDSYGSEEGEAEREEQIAIQQSNLKGKPLSLNLSKDGDSPAKSEYVKMNSSRIRFEMEEKKRENREYLQDKNNKLIKKIFLKDTMSR